MNGDICESVILKAMVILIVATVVMMCLMAAQTSRTPLLFSVGTPTWPEPASCEVAMTASPSPPDNGVRETYLVANVAPFSAVLPSGAHGATEDTFAQEGVGEHARNCSTGKQGLSSSHMALPKENLLGHNDGKICKQS